MPTILGFVRWALGFVDGLEGSLNRAGWVPLGIEFGAPRLHLRTIPTLKAA